MRNFSVFVFCSSVKFSEKEMSVQAFDIDFSGNLSTLVIEKHISSANVCLFPFLNYFELYVR